MIADHKSSEDEPEHGDSEQEDDEAKRQFLDHPYWMNKLNSMFETDGAKADKAVTVNESAQEEERVYQESADNGKEQDKGKWSTGRYKRRKEEVEVNIEQEVEFEIYDVGKFLKILIRVK